MPRIKMASLVHLVQLICVLTFVVTNGDAAITKRAVSEVVVSPKKVCVKEGEAAVTLDCTVLRKDYTCSWSSDAGLALTTLDAIKNEEISGVEAAPSAGDCGIKLVNITKDQDGAKYTCQAAVPDKGTKRDTAQIKVMELPKLLPTLVDQEEVTTESSNDPVLVSSTRVSKLRCSVPISDTFVFWRLLSTNITANVTTINRLEPMMSELAYQFTIEDRHKTLYCCYQDCDQEVCTGGEISMLYPANGFTSEHFKDDGVEVRFRVRPDPISVTWALTDKCDDADTEITPLDVATNENITVTMRNNSDNMFFSKLVILEANSTIEKQQVVITVTNTEGTTTYCTTYAKGGFGTGAIIGISVGVVASVTLLSLALFIYHKSRSENYAA